MEKHNARSSPQWPEMGPRGERDILTYCARSLASSFSAYVLFTFAAACNDGDGGGVVGTFVQV